MKRLLASLFCTSLLLLAACSKPAPSSERVAPVARHEHQAPHGGTAVVLGEEIYHLELVRDAEAGRLTAYVLDGEMEAFVRIKAATFEVGAVVAGARQTLQFRAIANAATGETVGSTSQFEAQAEWLKKTAAFDATLSALEIKGTTFTGVAFNFPKGNDKD